VKYYLLAGGNSWTPKSCCRRAPLILRNWANGKEAKIFVAGGRGLRVETPVIIRFLIPPTSFRGFIVREISERLEAPEAGTLTSKSRYASGDTDELRRQAAKSPASAPKAARK